MRNKYQIGMIGLGEMGRNLVLNLADHGIRVVGYDKDSQKTLASGNAVGRTGKTVGLGVDWKARGLAKALVKWASDYRPRSKDEDAERGDRTEKRR